MKKGFTLIELLVVMVVLAIIALITVPNALNMIETAQERSFRSSTQGLIKASENLYVLDKTGNGNVPVFILFENGIKTVYPNTKDIMFNGSNPESGGIHIFEDGSIKLALYDGTYCSIKNRTSEEITISKISENICLSNIYYEQTSAPFNNLITNGDFSNGTSGWIASNSTQEVVGRVLRLTGNGVGNQSYVGRSINIVLNNVYYYNWEARIINGNPDFLRQRSFNVTNSDVNVYNSIIGKWYVFSTNRTATATVSSYNIIVQSYSSASEANGKIMEIKKAITLDLTSLYGAGNEPTKEEMDEIINRVWINGSGVVHYFTAGGWKTF